MTVRKWRPREVERIVQKQMTVNMTQAMLYAEGQAKKLVSRGNRGGGNPSKPFDPPKVVTGTLRSNIGYEVSIKGGEVVGALGVKKGPANEYAKRLELGFVGTDSAGRRIDQKPRPFLRPTINDNMNQLKKILGVRK